MEARCALEAVWERPLLDWLDCGHHVGLHMSGENLLCMQKQCRDQGVPVNNNSEYQIQVHLCTNCRHGLASLFMMDGSTN